MPIITTLMNNSHIIPLDTDGPEATECSLTFTPFVQAVAAEVIEMFCKPQNNKH